MSGYNLPNAKLVFTNKHYHNLTVDNDYGVAEGLQLMALELRPDFYDAKDSSDPEIEHFENTEPLELKRYSSATINEKTFTLFTPELIEEFILARTAQLNLHPITGDWATIFIKLHTKTT